MNFLYTLIIFPFELIYKHLFLFLSSMLDSYGIALIILSCINYVLLLPLIKLTNKSQEKEKEIQNIIAPQLKRIKLESKGAERNQRINNLYARYSYNPIYAIRSSLKLFVQIPFLMAVYFMLIALENIEGVSFLFIQNLAVPDGLLGGINLLPLLMTAISIGNTFLFTSTSLKEKKQSIIIALLFFVLLYNAPSALLIYWISNNILFLLKEVCVSKSSKRSFPIMNQFFHFMKKVFPEPLSSTGLLFILAFFTPFFFVLTKNLHMFFEQSVIHTLFILLAPMFVLFVVGVVADLVRKKLINQSINRFKLSKHMDSLTLKEYITNIPFLLENILLIACLWYAVYLLFRISINLGDYIPSRDIVKIIHLFLIILFFILVKKYSLKIINVFLILLFLLTIVQVPFAIRGNEKNIPTQVANINNIHSNHLAMPDLKNKPNIYLFFLESFHDFRTMKAEYDIPVEEMEQTLSAKGFHFYENFYSNYQYTLASLCSLYLMDTGNPHDFMTGNADITSTWRYFIGGSIENPLFVYLKTQGYHTSAYYTKFPNYYTYAKGATLDTLYNDFLLTNLKPMVEYILNTINPRLNEYLTFYVNNLCIEKEYQGDKKTLSLQEAFNIEIDAIQKRSRPTFFIYKGGANHTATENYEYERDFPSFKIEYQEMVENSYNNEILPTIAMIEEKDPNAIIILLGDHGASSYRFVVPYAVKTFNEIMQHLRQEKKTIEDFASSWHAVMLGVKMPKSANQDISFDKIMSPVNLFRHVFASIDNNKIFIEGSVPNISRWQEIIILREGKVIEGEGNILTSIDNEEK